MMIDTKDLNRTTKILMAGGGGTGLNFSELTSVSPDGKDGSSVERPFTRPT